MRIYEVTGRKRKKSKRIEADAKTDWEKNLTKLRSKERALDANSPIKPVKLD